MLTLTNIFSTCCSCVKIRTRVRLPVLIAIPSVIIFCGLFMILDFQSEKTYNRLQVFGQFQLQQETFINFKEIPKVNNSPLDVAQIAFRNSKKKVKSEPVSRIHPIEVVVADARQELNNLRSDSLTNTLDFSAEALVKMGVLKTRIRTFGKSEAEILKPALKADTDWQLVIGTSEKFYVYAAYYHARRDEPSHTIRIIGAGKTYGNEKLECQFHDRRGLLFNTSNATISFIREHWDMKYSACFVLCPLSPNDVRPSYVSVISQNSSSENSLHLLEVADATRKINATEASTLDYGDFVQFSVCVKPIHYNYDKGLAFMEWMEFHKLMGVRHFTFYNHTMGPQLDCILRNAYQNQVTLLPWNLPMISQKEIRTEGIFAALNDCLYRRRGFISGTFDVHISASTRYLAVLDFDEMIVPHKALNYSELLKSIDNISENSKNGAYLFQNGFFYLQFPNYPSFSKLYNFTGFPTAENLSQKMLMLQKLQRKAELYPHGQRSKYICDPEKVVEAGNHFLWEMASNYTTVNVPEDLGVLHHYRLCEFGGDDCIKDPSVTDDSITPFGKELAIRIAMQVETIGEVCAIS